MPPPFSEFIDALGREIDAIRGNRRALTISLQRGYKSGTAGGEYIYEFELTDLEKWLRDDSPVTLRVAGRDISGTLISAAEGTIRIAVREDLGPTIETAQLVVDDAFLLERLKSTLQDIKDGTSDVTFNTIAATALLNNAPTRVGPGPVADEVFQSGERLNEEQQKAVRLSTGCTLLYLWGPPGTGKTLTLAAMAHAHVLAGKTVLLVSNTNIAVDTALERIGDRLATLPSFHQGAVIRHGPIVSESLLKKYGNQVNVDAVVARLGEPLQAEKECLEAEASQLSVSIKQLKGVVAAHEIPEALSRQLDELHLQQARARQRVHELRESLNTKHKYKENVLRDLERAQRTGVVARFFLGLSIDRLKSAIARCDMDLASLSGAVASAENQRRDLTSKVDDVGQQLNLARGATGGELSHQECTSRLASKQQQFESNRSRLQDIARQLDELRARVVANCRVLGTTVYQSYLKKDIARPFDVVIVDEASMLSLPLVFYAAGLATKHVIVGGDFRQLPPIVRNDKDEVCAQWLKQDVFQKARIVAAVNSGNTPTNLAILTEQYRMAHPICDLISSLFYEGRLRTAPGVDDSLGDVPACEGSTNHLLYIDTSQWKPWAAKPTGSNSRYNPFHALLIRNLVQNQQQRGFLSETGDRDHLVGIVSPYTAQSRLITQVLQECLQRSAAPLAATAHRFQGNEREVIICDIADSDACKPSGFICARSIAEDGSRLLNVALSRGKRTVVLVANFRYVRTRVPRDAALRRVLDYFEQHGEALNVLGLIPSDTPGAPRNAPSEAPPSPSDGLKVFSQETFYAAFIDDCLKARESLVVYSPFITQNGVNRWCSMWEQLIAHGARIRVVTRPPNGQIGDADEAADLIRRITAAHVTVDLRRGMHQKIAFIDNTLVWHGSLNILSHNNTAESMLRIQSPALVKQIGLNLAAKKADSIDLAQQENPICSDCKEVSVLTEKEEFQCDRCNRRWDRRGRPATQGQGGDSSSASDSTRDQWINDRDWKGKAMYLTKNGVRGVAILKTRQEGLRQKLTIAFYVQTSRGLAVPPHNSDGFVVSRDNQKLSDVQFFGQ